MLLLVLILVLVAFGLLVVALLTSSVTWAWVSVAVSVAAAGVLLLDWLQRRSAVRVGDRQVPAAPAAGTLGPEPARIPGGDAITEVIPIVRPGYPDQPDATADGATEEASGRPGAEGQYDDERSDVQATTVLPLVQPSGSGEVPSGADPALTASSTVWSPSVTESAPSSTPDADEDDGAAAVPEAVPLAPSAGQRPEPSVDLFEPAGPKPAGGLGDDVEPEPAEAGPTPDKGPDRDMAPVGARPAGAAEESLDEEAPAAEPTPERSAAEFPDEQAPSDEAAVAPVIPVVPADAPGKAVEDEAPLEDEPAAPAEPAAVDVPDAEPEEPGASVEPVAAGSARSDAEATVVVDVRAARSGGGTLPEMEPAHEEPDAGRTTVVELPAAEPQVPVLPAAGAAPAAPPVLPPAGPDGEPPEERTDPAAAAIVAQLDDQVVVVDEHPRYHVPGCPSLVGRQLIPLPAAEAVELGFTPCGWCTPDQVLSTRHRAPVRY